MVGWWDGKEALEGAQWRVATGDRRRRHSSSNGGSRGGTRASLAVGSWARGRTGVLEQDGVRRAAQHDEALLLEGLVGRLPDLGVARRLHERHVRRQRPLRAAGHPRAPDRSGGVDARRGLSIARVDGRVCASGGRAR
eukprot:4426228-Prymnesium_polylepis.1